MFWLIITFLILLMYAISLICIICNIFLHWKKHDLTKGMLKVPKSISTAKMPIFKSSTPAHYSVIEFKVPKASYCWRVKRPKYVQECKRPPGSRKWMIQADGRKKNVTPLASRGRKCWAGKYSAKQAVGNSRKYSRSSSSNTVSGDEIL